MGKVEGGLGVLVTNKGGIGGQKTGRKEKRRWEGGRRMLCQYYGLQKAQGEKGNAPWQPP